MRNAGQLIGQGTRDGELVAQPQGTEACEQCKYRTGDDAAACDRALIARMSAQGTAAIAPNDEAVLLTPNFALRNQSTAREH